MPGKSLIHDKFSQSTDFTRLYPKKVMHWVILGFVVVVLPLLFALGNATYFMQQIATRSHDTVEHSTLAVRLSRSLGDYLAGMERNARVYQVVGDADLLDVYAEFHLEFERTAAKLLMTESDPAMLQKITRLLTIDVELYQLFSEQPPNSGKAIEALDRFGTMRGIVREMVDKNSDLIERRVQGLYQYSSDARTVLLWEALMVIPVATLLGLMIMSRVTTPMKQLDKGIRQLGDGDISRQITVEGPEDIRVLGDRLEWLRERLSELANQKRLFLQHISHELKTPLASIREGTCLLKDEVIGALNQQQNECVDILHKSGIQLQKRIEDLLAFSVSEDIGNNSALDRQDLTEIIDSVIYDYQLLARAKNIRIVSTLENGNIRGDKEKLTAIVDNLMSNAVKYSPDGGTIHVSMRVSDERIVVDVVDDGPGVDLSDRSHIFEPFYQGSAKYSGHLKGTGLGLSIAKVYANWHGGDLTIVPSNKGAFFRIELPRYSQSIGG